VRRTVSLTLRHQSTHITHQFPNLDLYADCNSKHFLWTSNGNVINTRKEQTAVNYEIIVLFLFSSTVYTVEISQWILFFENEFNKTHSLTRCGSWNPSRFLASSTSFLHSFLLFAKLISFFILLIAFITWSFHLLLGLPTGLFPSIVLWVQ
jgi:hypothetical protein